MKQTSPSHTAILSLRRSEPISAGATSQELDSPGASAKVTPGSTGGYLVPFPSLSMTSPASPNTSESTPANCSLPSGEPDVTWTRLSDNFVEDRAFDGLSAEVRWHYLCLVQYCSRTGRYDGCVTRYNARYVSGSEPAMPPDQIVSALIDRGLLVESPDDGTVVVVRIDEHVPPPHMRDEQRKPAVRARVQRHRERKRSISETRDVTRYPGTGRAGTGRRTPRQSSERSRV